MEIPTCLIEFAAMLFGHRSLLAVSHSVRALVLQSDGQLF